ncbi:MAG: hypothetical protein WCH46_02170 [bacterium]
MNTYLRLLFSPLLLLGIVGCEGSGFRKIEGANEKATVASGQEALQQIELALTKYKEVNGTYPRITETTLYDTLRNYFVIALDPNHLYRNEKDQSNYIAVGGRKNKIIYRYPPTLGSGEYTLYWTGLNAIDEEGRGDDIFSSKGKAPKQLARKLTIPFKGDSSKVEFSLSASGSDLSKDSVKFIIKVGSSTLFSDWWMLGSYVDARPELSEPEKQETINMEFDRFLHQIHFTPADSLLRSTRYASLGGLFDRTLLRELAKKNLSIFTYYGGSKGVRAIYWNPKERKMNSQAITSR